MFELTDLTEARLASVTNRIEKHGDEDVPAVSLTVEFTAENTLLDLIDPGLRHALYKAKPDAEPELPDMEQTTPVLRCNSIDKVRLTTAHEGWRLFVDDNIDESDPMAFGGVKVDKLELDALQGGSVKFRMRLGTSDVDADKIGALGMNNGQSIWLRLLKPEKVEPAIDGTTEAFNRDHPGAAEGQGSLLDTDASSEPRDDGKGTFADDMGEGDPDPDDDGSGHTDSGADEQAQLEAGMRESLAAAGVKPKRQARAKVH
jgi:hypothetical protein